MAVTRYVDTLPQPTSMRRPMKVIVLSFSRTGTLGLYRALNILGHKCYHTVEMLHSGVPHLRLFNEAQRLRSQAYPGRPYSRADFDRWLAPYDALADIPCYLAEEVVAAYPEARFVLVERDPDAWVASVQKTIGVLVAAIPRFPLAYFRLFDAFVDEFLTFNEQVLRAITRGRGVGDEGWGEARGFYVEYLAKMKKLVPEDRLCVVRLEDGLGWEQICPFLGVPIPETKYPRGNDPLEFKGIVDDALTPGIRKAIFTTGAAVVGAVSIGAWYLMS